MDDWMQIWVRVNIYFFALLLVFLTVCRQKLITNRQELNFMPSSRADRNYQQERIPIGQPNGKTIFPDDMVLSAKY